MRQQRLQHMYPASGEPLWLVVWLAVPLWKDSHSTGMHLRGGPAQGHQQLRLGHDDFVRGRSCMCFCVVRLDVSGPCSSSFGRPSGWDSANGGLKV
jgi:hypothetical protein